jgi:hypothetical protein
MRATRKGETEPQPRFRESRFFHSLDEWYFLTREATVEGPFKNRTEAEHMLKSYINQMQASVQ